MAATPPPATAPAASAAGSAGAAAAGRTAVLEGGGDAVRVLVEGQALLMAEVARLERVVAGGAGAGEAEASRRAAAHVHTLQARLSAAEAHVEQLRRENARLEAAAGTAVPALAARTVPGMVKPTAVALLPSSSLSPPPAGGGRWAREAALEVVVHAQTEQLARQDRDLRALAAEAARLREYSAFHIEYWRTTAHAHEAALARLRAELALAAQSPRTPRSPSPASSVSASASVSVSTSATVAVAGLLKSPRGPGAVRRAPSSGAWLVPLRDTAHKACQAVPGDLDHHDGDSIEADVAVGADAIGDHAGAHTLGDASRRRRSPAVVALEQARAAAAAAAAPPPPLLHGCGRSCCFGCGAHCCCWDSCCGGCCARTVVWA
jgi:cell division protein FtsB